MGSGYSEIFDVICRFLPYRRKKCAIVNSVNSGVSGTNVTEIVHNVEKFILSDLLKSELRYCNLFRNGIATSRLVRKNADIMTLTGCHGNVP